MKAKGAIPINDVIELTALVDMKAGDIVVYDLDTMTATHSPDWNYMGMALTDGKAGEKVKVGRRGKITITASASTLLPIKSFADIDALKDALQADYDYFEHDVFDE